MRSVKDRMEEQRREYLEKKLREAEEKRQRQLNLKVMKAHEEETKVNCQYIILYDLLYYIILYYILDDKFSMALS